MSDHHIEDVLNRRIDGLEVQREADRHYEGILCRRIDVLEVRLADLSSRLRHLASILQRTGDSIEVAFEGMPATPSPTSTDRPRSRSRTPTRS